MWFIVVLMLALLAWVLSQRVGTVFSSTEKNISEEISLNLPAENNPKVEIPEFKSFNEINWVSRETNVHTVIPERSRDAMTTYEVQAGDSIFSIAKQFKLEPETVLWANEDLLQDNANDLSIGQNLKIPPTDGVVYKWKTNDTVEGIARKFKTTTEAILTWPANNIDLGNPKIASGTMVMVPGGSRQTRSWVVPTFWRPNAGATRGIQSQCGAGGTAMGSGTFLWPTASRLISGNDYWSGHLGIDIGAAMGAPVYASDGGVVVYAGGIDGGYGLMVMIDHGNGFHTLYAHLSQILVRCGQNVAQGNTIAYSGSTGNSTGPHLHFEIRFMGAFVNPHDYLR